MDKKNRLKQVETDGWLNMVENIPWQYLGNQERYQRSAGVKTIGIFSSSGNKNLIKKLQNNKIKKFIKQIKLNFRFFYLSVICFVFG